MAEINVAAVEQSERECPFCGAVAKRRSIDGGLTSQYHGECGHSWDVTIKGKCYHGTLTPIPAPDAALCPRTLRVAAEMVRGHRDPGTTYEEWRDRLADRIERAADRPGGGEG